MNQQDPTMIGRFGSYVATEQFVATTLQADKIVGQDDTGEDVTERLRIRQMKRVLILAHDSGDKVAFTIRKMGQKVTFRDSRAPKRTTTVESAVSEVSRMLGINDGDAAAMLSAYPTVNTEDAA